MTAVIAHRGASADAPENTVEAFELARRQGADAVELDVRISEDGILVVHHDPVLADGRIIAATPAGAMAGRAVRLEEALEACGDIWVNIEIKSDPNEVGFDPRDPAARALPSLLARRGDPPTRWLVSSFRRPTLDVFGALAPRVPTAWLCLSPPPGALEGLVLDGHRGIHPYVDCVSSGLIERCHDLGLVCNTWTCDDPERIAELVGWGIDGVCTNRPALARQVIGASPGITRVTASGT